MVSETDTIASPDELMPLADLALEAEVHPARLYAVVIGLGLSSELRRIGRSSFIRRSVADRVKAHLAIVRVR